MTEESPPCQRPETSPRTGPASMAELTSQIRAHAGVELGDDEVADLIARGRARRP